MQLRGGLGGAGRGSEGGVEAFLRRIRGQEKEKEVVGEDTVVQQIVEGLVEEVVKLSA